MKITSQNWQNFINSGSIIRLNMDNYLVGWGERQYFDSPKDSEKPFFYFPDFFLKIEKPWFQHQYSSLISIDQLLHLLPKKIVSASKWNWSNPYITLFKDALNELKEFISKGILQKAVPYVFDQADGSFSNEHKLEILSSIIIYTKEIPLHVYGFWDSKEGILGASPEILFKYSDETAGLLETIACAGTKSNNTQNLMCDQKEMHEHQLVVRGIEQSLSHFGRVIINPLQVLKLPKLSHLTTPIHVEMKEKFDFLAITHALHPTPALGAFPKESGNQWLTSYNTHIPRHRFGAPVGCLMNNGKQAKCLVGIRNVQWDSERIKIGAGCGIVKESSFENEWQEILLKIASIKEMMSL